MAVVSSASGTVEPTRTVVGGLTDDSLGSELGRIMSGIFSSGSFFSFEYGSSISSSGSISGTIPWGASGTPGPMTSSDDSYLVEF